MTLWLIFTFSCSVPTPRQWLLETTVTKYPQFNSALMILEPDSEISYVTLQLLRSTSGLHMYLNVLLLKTPPMENDPTRTTLELLVEGQEPFLFYPYILNGEQRLLVPSDVADYIIELLLYGETFCIKAGRFKITVIPDHFQEAYNELMTLDVLCG